MEISNTIVGNRSCYHCLPLVLILKHLLEYIFGIFCTYSTRHFLYQMVLY